MGAIRILPPGLVNRIAAGECVERPASIVKELIENAIDAGAGRIDVSVAEGGRELIAVSDDGCGMDAEDLALSVHPHATSKIRTDEDLFGIHTMGFRGEALASIASVARVQITSRRRESDVAYSMRIEGGEMSRPAPCAAPPGTTVEVRDLFCCVPARRKFLKTNQTEMGHISEQFVRIALAYPTTAFALKHGGRSVYQLAAVDDRKQRIADFFGPELAAVLLPVRREGGGVRVEGFVAPPAESRGSGKWEYTFVNGRYVRDRFVSHAVKEAYRSLIDPARYPVTFLFISIDPEQVDVNVHPTKIEVRWRDSNYLHGQVLATLREKFLGSNLDHALKTPGDDDAYRERVRRAMMDFFTRARSAQPQPRLFGAEAESSTGQRAAVQSSAAQGAGPAAAQRAASPAAGSAPAANQRLETRAQSPPPRSDNHGSPSTARSVPGGPTFPPRHHAQDSGLGAQDLPALGLPRAPRAMQVHNTFLVAETHDGIMIIDQHALHERVLYEELRRRVAERPLESQRLLIPDIVRIPPDRLEALETHADTLARLGVEITAIGPQSVAVHAFPSFLHERTDRGRFVLDLLDLLSEKGARPQRDTLLHEVLDMLACKAAVKAGDPLTPAEIEELLAGRESAERSSHCPHGRPTTLHLSLRDLERQFHRR